MRGVVAKRLRQVARRVTVGKSTVETRTVYHKLKKKVKRKRHCTHEHSPVSPAPAVRAYAGRKGGYDRLRVSDDRRWWDARPGSRKEKRRLQAEKGAER